MVDTPEGPVEKLTPCSPGHPDAIEKAWTDVESNQLHEPKLDVKDFEKAIEVNRPTVTMADIQKHIEFTNESGELCSFIPGGTRCGLGGQRLHN
jgi:vacuolar protein-sorting-associated protein 4